MNRKSIDALSPGRGLRLQIFFPHDRATRHLVTTGEQRDHEGKRASWDFEVRDELSGRTEWVPGWYVARIV